MSDTEILDKGETLVEFMSWSTVSRYTGFSFETITYISEVRCARCGDRFPISISDKRPSEEVYGKTAGGHLIEPLEFAPYCCPCCGAKITGIYACITGGD